MKPEERCQCVCHRENVTLPVATFHVAGPCCMTCHTCGETVVTQRFGEHMRRHEKDGES
jgi:hypothetical protein